MRPRRVAVTIQDEQGLTTDRKVVTIAEACLLAKRQIESLCDSGIGGKLVIEPQISQRVNNITVRPIDDGGWECVSPDGKVLEAFRGEEARLSAIGWARETEEFKATAIQASPRRGS